MQMLDLPMLASVRLPPLCLACVCGYHVADVAAVVSALVPVVAVHDTWFPTRDACNDEA